MPYITQEQRRELDAEILSLAEKIKNNHNHTHARNGEMNYTISRLIREVYGPKRIPDPGAQGTWRYADINDVVGMLACANMEFYRKVAAPYEDIKEEQNGIVYD